MTIRNLDYMFKPSSIAIIGQGRKDDDIDTLLEMNLIKAGFKGPVMPVNPDRRAVSGVLTYKNVASLPEVPDLAIITTPLDGAPALIGELGARGTRAVLLINSEKLKHRPDEGEALKQAMLDAAKPYILRLLGPDRLGMAVPAGNVSATLSHGPLLSGHLALLTQSSAIMRTVINWAQRRRIGFSHMISLGGQLDVDFSDMLDYLARDYRARSIIMYMERTRNPRKFMSAARVAARVKPVIVLRPRSHGDSAVEDAIYDAAFRRAGILRANTLEELFSAAETLAYAKPVYRNNLIIMGNSRSIGLLTSDVLTSNGGSLAEITESTQSKLASFLSPASHVDNPIDLGHHAGAKEYEQALELMIKEPGADGVLIVHIPTVPEWDAEVAQAIVKQAAKSRRLVMVSWTGSSGNDPERHRFREAGIASYGTPDEAAFAFLGVANYYFNQRLLMETPASIPEEFNPDVDAARRLVSTALAAGRDQLNIRETIDLLTAYSIPMVDTRFAFSPEDAADVAAEFDTPVALKILSPDIVERADVGGLALALDAPEEVSTAASAMLKRLRNLAPKAVINGFTVQPMLSRHNAFELTIGVRTSRLFGDSPVLFFGQGGTEIQVINDLAYAIPPLNMHLAHELIGRTRVHTMLGTSPGRPVDLDAVALTLIKVSQMIVDLGEIVELDINPLWAGGNGVLALDAKIRITENPISGTERLAIRPYPKHLEQSMQLPNGHTLFLRPIRPEDGPVLQEMVRRMPEEDRRLRFFQPIKELSPEMAARLTQLDYDREMALIVTEPGVPGKTGIWGVVRMNADPSMEKAEYAVAIDRSMTGQGMGPMLMRQIIDYARSRGIKDLYGEVLRENEPMLKINRALGFTIKPQPDDPGTMHVSLAL